MGDKSNIEWTNATWNPIVGCDIVSPGCTNCYAMKMAARIETMRPSHYTGTTKKVNGNAVWTGKVALAPDHILTAPLRWKKPRKIFVNSMGDLFHEAIPDADIDRAFAVMALSPQHTFQVLTKRAERMRDYCCALHEGERSLLTAGKEIDGQMGAIRAQGALLEGDPDDVRSCPLPNVWLGVSCERQQEADERIPLLLATPAAIRFISAEPLLGAINLIGLKTSGNETWDALRGNRTPMTNGSFDAHFHAPAKLDWVIVGGESGPHYRAMEEAWAANIIEQCLTAGVAPFMKQMAGKTPIPSRLMVRLFPAVDRESQAARVKQK